MALSDGSRRKLIEFDGERWQALEMLARDRMASIQELADEAFRDLLVKHRRPESLSSALKQSVRATPANEGEIQARKPRRKRGRPIGSRF